MTDRPIPFSPPMIRALLDGRKTQTRRHLRIRRHRSFSDFGRSDTPGYDWHFRDASSSAWHDLSHAELLARLPYAVGDRLWVREAWRTWRDDDEMRPADIVDLMDDDPDFRPNIEYLADMAVIPRDFHGEWCPGRRRAGMHLPRRLSRLTLVVTDVRVQRLQDISEADALSEGVLVPEAQCAQQGAAAPILAYAGLWEDINGVGSWAADPWVTAYTFDTHTCNIGQMEAPHG